MPILVSSRFAEVLHLHLLEFASSEGEVAGRDLVAERFALLGYAEWDTDTAAINHVVKIDEHRLRGLWAEVDNVVISFNGPDMRAKHEVEVAWFAEFATAIGATVSF